MRHRFFDAQFPGHEVRKSLWYNERHNDPDVIAHRDEHLAVVDNFQEQKNQEVQLACILRQNVGS